MVQMESPSTDKMLVDRLARFIGSQFERIGGVVDYIPADRFGDQVRIQFQGHSSENILLLGHTDTVFAVGEVAKRPFQIRDGRATGPGVFDMKAGIALPPDPLEAHYLAGKALLKMDRYSEARGELLISAKLSPKDARPYFLLAQVYDRLSDPQQASQARQIFSMMTQRRSDEAEGMSDLRP
jgi:tetratricopeptide (TPR) repeat protein